MVGAAQATSSSSSVAAVTSPAYISSVVKLPPPVTTASSVTPWTSSMVTQTTLHLEEDGVVLAIPLDRGRLVMA